jgi:hypothetical protein
LPDEAEEESPEPEELEEPVEPEEPDEPEEPEEPEEPDEPEEEDADPGAWPGADSPRSPGLATAGSCGSELEPARAAERPEAPLELALALE